MLITLLGKAAKYNAFSVSLGMENELENMSKQELIEQLLTLQKSNQKLESSNQKLESSNQKLDFVNQKKDQDIAKKEDDIARLNIIVANLQRMLFGSKKERFINENKDQLALSFEEFASQEALADETPVKEKITYERKKTTKHAGRNKLPENLPVVEEIIEPEDLTEDMAKMGEEITEMLEYTPAQFFKRRIIRPNTYTKRLKK
ncbi:IS66 family transposase [Brumimicrobium salinarum]|nr:hypothetical protein [Brumimicrobium salinarum]